MIRNSFKYFSAVGFTIISFLVSIVCFIYVWGYFAIVVFSFITFDVWYIRIPIIFIGWFIYTILTAVPILLILPLGKISYIIERLGSPALRSKDYIPEGPIVLYLRSFATDTKRLTNKIERRLADHCRNIGHFVAISSPDEIIPPTTGALRINSTNKKWQSEVTFLINKSSIIIINLQDIAPGFVWELNQLLEMGVLKKVILVITKPINNKLEPWLERFGVDKEFLEWQAGDSSYSFFDSKEKIVMLQNTKFKNNVYYPIEEAFSNLLADKMNNIIHRTIVHLWLNILIKFLQLQ